MTREEAGCLHVGDVVRLRFATGRKDETGTVDEVRLGPVLVISWHDEPGQGVMTEDWQLSWLTLEPLGPIR